MLKEILDLIIKWAVPFLCGAAISFAASLLVRLGAIKNGLQCLLRAEIIRGNEKYIERGHCPIYAKEALTKAYKAYHALGGNDVATALYNDVMALPAEDGGKGKEVTKGEQK